MGLSGSEMFHWIVDSVSLVMIGVSAAAAFWYTIQREWRSVAWFTILGVTMAMLFCL